MKAPMELAFAAAQGLLQAAERKLQLDSVGFLGTSPLGLD